MKVKTVIYLVEADVLSKVITIFSRKTFAWSIWNSYNQIKKEQMLSLEVEYRNFVNDIKKILGFMILKGKDFFLGLLNRGTYVYTFIKIDYCVIWKKNRKNSLPNGVEEIDKSFKYVKNKINESKWKKRIRYRFPKQETIDQLENMFVID